MHCERLTCIYNDGKSCRLSGISICTNGTCSECVDVYLDPDTLANMRDQQYREMLKSDMALFDHGDKKV